MRTLLGLTLAGLVLVACTPSTPPSTEPTTPDRVVPSVRPSPPVSAAGGTLRFALGSNPASIDPRFVGDDEGLLVVDALFDSLVAVGADLQTVEPAAATSWTVSDDGLTWSFRLRADATYHDGTPVVAGDFVSSFRRLVDPTTSPRSFLGYQLADVEGYAEAVAGEEPLRGVSAPDDLTFVVQLVRPVAEFLLVLAHPSLAPVPDDGVSPEVFATQPVGNGPFAMAEAWQPNQFIRVSRFARHHDPARLDEVVFQIFAADPSRQQQYGDFQRGQVDVAEVPPASLSEAAGTYGVSRDGVTGPGLLDGLTGAIYALGFNTTAPPFDDPAVRRAVTLLVDRDRIVSQILLGARAPADTLVPPSLPGGQGGRCVLCRYDEAAALAELGIARSDEPTGTEGPTASEGPGPGAPIAGPIEILVNSGATNERIAARVAADVERVLGVDVTTRTADPAAFVGEVRAGQVQLFRLGWQADHPSAGAVLHPLFHSEQIGQDNLMGFSDPEVDALLDEARVTVDAGARRLLYRRAELRILELAPVAPVFLYPINRVVAASVVGLRMSPIGTANLAAVSKRDAA